MNTVMSLKGRDFLTLLDFSTEEIFDLLALAGDLKAKQKAGMPYTPLAGKTMAMIFEKPSTRTRVSFEVGMIQLGGSALYLNSNDLQLGRGETIADTARVLSQYVDVIMIRTFAHQKVEELAEYASIPVINGLTDDDHPCQALADLLTIYEVKKTFQGIKLAYVGDGNNVANALLAAAAKVGMDVAIACPPGYEPKAAYVEAARQIGEKTGAAVTVTHDPLEAVAGADAIYTDVWTSMGQESESDERLQVFQPYQVNEALVKAAKPDYIFLHCLPAHRGEEVTAGVMDGPNSMVFEQAGNRLHAQKAILVSVL
ncbi:MULTISPECIES: ornithine carbamoyltransferase [Geobacillus]|jgi:ornithine carbamoyltransferase|uniref:Ornithine carbamoyltransferase n=1 Tax=Geobacillus thermodenitrificans (strain NG80-2) TaxID=420246 RepID=A4IL52_GEOTN|nr:MULTISPECIES: ornithine carbamoyltransferase [Geobacillus]ABO66056.1 Ornithine carbamoyltransferase [Geobacillus thermodenitrificans NG80-2]ARP41788.1 Ornithine carbamoyltransferase [Geobacillus thermodenitrificans]ATO36834.1 ornithine carbamoyltransferase [Geobacillus thermodenitrificans]MED0664030.1 ornithine carbamoyltransferase [Geobacillus thermodenitrificans]MED4916641.1 ornithine carbamoyltransferase [Geobacillus thermodenitrificans]